MESEDDPECRAILPAFVAEIHEIFEPWQIAECLERNSVGKSLHLKSLSLAERAEMRRWGYVDRRLMERATKMLLEGRESV